MILQRDPAAIEDMETKQIYHYLFRLLRKGVANCSTPIPDFQTLGSTPYEDPCISRAIMALLAFRYGHVAPAEWFALVDLGKILLHTINIYKLEVPSIAAARLGVQLYEPYKVMYTRWVFPVPSSNALLHFSSLCFHYFSNMLSLLSGGLYCVMLLSCAILFRSTR